MQVVFRNYFVYIIEKYFVKSNIVWNSNHIQRSQASLTWDILCKVFFMDGPSACLNI